MTSLPSELLIREAGTGDWGRVAELVWALNLYEQPITGDRRTDRAAAVRYLAGMRRRVRRTRGQVLLAGPPDNALGMIAWGEESDPVFVAPPWRRRAQVFDLVVAAAARRRGIGTALLRAVEAEATARGLCRLAIGVLAGNDAAEAAYRRFGFRPYATELIKPLNEA
ncbi:GNAT family N-acetyltransferase [Elioraea sp.]|uniref:GNAT family N-acetyltransferase n=1 Tax=Elioraea sp. TaxID=2185103 RepID=UPI003F6E5AA1